MLVRWEYVCRGVCSFQLSDEEMDAGEMLEQEDAIDVEDVENPDRWHRCGTNVKLVVSTSVARLNTHTYSLFSD